MVRAPKFFERNRNPILPTGCRQLSVVHPCRFETDERQHFKVALGAKFREFPMPAFRHGAALTPCVGIAEFFVGQIHKNCRGFAGLRIENVDEKFPEI